MSSRLFIVAVDIQYLGFQPTSLKTCLTNDDETKKYFRKLKRESSLRGTDYMIDLKALYGHEVEDVDSIIISKAALERITGFTPVSKNEFLRKMDNGCELYHEEFNHQWHDTEDDIV